VSIIKQVHNTNELKAANEENTAKQLLVINCHFKHVSKIWVGTVSACCHVNIIWYNPITSTETNIKDIIRNRYRLKLFDIEQQSFSIVL